MLLRVHYVLVLTGMVQEHENYAAWRSVVHRYTFRDITFVSDRIPAMAGVAAEFRKTLRDGNYCYGLWSDDPLSLLWSQYKSGLIGHSNDEGFSPVRPSYPVSTQPPSWSWASLNHPVDWFVERFSSLPAPETPWPTYSKINFPVDEDNSPILEIEGPLLKLDLDKLPMKDRVGCDITGTMRPRVLNEHLPFASCFDHWFLDRSYLDFEYHRIHTLGLAPVYFMPLHKVPRGKNGKSYASWGILLERADSAERGTYIRIGCGSLERDKNKSGHRRQFAEHQHDLLPDDYVEMKQDGKLKMCTIHVV
jgi:hypothetical protein